MAEETSKHDASLKGLREQVRMWEKEALGLRGRLAACEAEAHRERGILEGEASRLRLARDDARRQAEALHAECTNRLARSRAELDDALEQIERLRRDKDDQLQRQRQDLSIRFEEERKGLSRLQAQEAEKSRQQCETLQTCNQDLEQEIVRLRTAKEAAETKLRTLNDTHVAAERKSAHRLSHRKHRSCLSA